jgi:hypothetical protein
VRCTYTGPNAFARFCLSPAWAAPLLWRSEPCNVLALYVRRDLLSLRDAHQIVDEAESLLRGREYQVSSWEVLGLVAASQCSAYACEFVARARDLAVPLVTVYAQILRRFPAVALPLEVVADLSNWPPGRLRSFERHGHEHDRTVSSSQQMASAG